MATHQKHLYPDHAQNVLRRLNQQRRAGHQLCNIAIQVQDYVFWAHKCILCGSSGYFASVLSNNTTDKITLPGLTPQGVAVVLDFVYTSELNLTIENALETNNAANFLQVMDILNNCSTFLAAALRPLPEVSGARNVHSTSSDVGNRHSVSSPLGSVSPSSGSQDDSRCKLGYPVLSTMLQECTAKAATSSTLNASQNQQSTQSESRPSSGQSGTKNAPRIPMSFSPEPSRQAVIRETSEWSPCSNDNRELTFNPNRLSQRDRDGVRSAVVVKIENEDNEVTSCSQENETASPFRSQENRNSEEGSHQSSLRTKRFKTSSGSPSARLSADVEDDHSNHGHHGNRATSQEDAMGSLVLSCTSDSTAVLDEVEGQGSEDNPRPDLKGEVLREGSSSLASHDRFVGNQHVLLQTTLGASADVQADVMQGTIVLCDECGALFSSQSSLQQHRLSVHNCMQPFKCHICPAAFHRSYELDRHLVSHSLNFTTAQGSSDTPPSVVIAGTSFTEQRDISDKPFRCEMCQISFKTKSNLSQHNLFRHTEERPFKCELCQAGFKRTFELNRHMNTHNRRRDMDGTF
ncbi:ZBTB17 [Branchiostoma lanceolatum]|uniref:ZBTB17 protein n=1 Tax=Branchiostoma lanceolatum TaxID=7740 RepID=A0A8K0EHP1_BRALA|nr:ZBTB17 [Branchiostoma lanceolatum]